MLGIILGAAFVAYGVVGYVAVPEVGFFDPAGGLLVEQFTVNPLQDLVHVVIGLALAGAAVAGLRASRTTNAALGAVCLGLGLLGLFIVGTPANVLALNGPGNVVHLGASVVLLGVGIGAERDRPAAA
jgi:hypothetical protein